MKITAVNVKMPEHVPSKQTLLAYAEVIFDDQFVLGELKVISGKRGLFIAMPSRHLTDKCPTCGKKNILKAHFCNWCGCELSDYRAQVDSFGTPILHSDVAHPLTVGFREMMELAVIAEYQAQLDCPSKSPNLRSEPC